MVQSNSKGNGVARRAPLFLSTHVNMNHKKCDQIITILLFSSGTVKQYFAAMSIKMTNAQYLLASTRKKKHFICSVAMPGLHTASKRKLGSANYRATERTLTAI